jgi:hypothetical protein
MMSSRDSLLNEDPMPWLLKKENSSLDYWALIDLLDRSMADALAGEAKQATSVSRSSYGYFPFTMPKAIGARMNQNLIPHRELRGALSLAHMLVLLSDGRTRAGCESFLQYSQAETGGLSLVKTYRSGIFLCTTGEHLPFLVYFGLTDQPQVRKAFFLSYR